MRTALTIVLMLAVAPQSAAEDPLSFELQWNGSGNASLTIERQPDGGITVSSSLTLADAAVPLSDVFCIQEDAQARQNCRAQDVGLSLRLLSMKWIVVGGDRQLFVAWTVHHTCEANEPTHYFKVVDGNDFSRELGFAAKAWRQSNNSMSLTARPVTTVASATAAPGRAAGYAGRYTDNKRKETTST